MKTGPGKWSDWLFADLPGSQPPSFMDFGEEMSSAVLMAAQDWVAQYTVLVGPDRMEEDIATGRNISPASGVLIRLCGDVYGVLTAAHVLQLGDDNTKDAASVTILAPPKPPGQSGGGMRLPARRCTVDGFGNKTEHGPDIAVIPLWKEEWETLKGYGWEKSAYDLDRVRWPDDEKTEFRKMKKRWAVSVILGARVGSYTETTECRRWRSWRRIPG